MISVLTPTLGRATRLAAVAANIVSATRSPVEVVVIAEADDVATIEAAKALDVVLVVNSRTRSWSGAINDGFAHMSGDYLFTGSDDLLFHDGWDVPALALLASRPELRVCGTNDLGNPGVLAGLTSTSHLVDRRYIDQVGGVIDQPPGIVQNEGYDHNYTDTEFVETARSRGAFSPCLESVVEHLHPNFGKSGWDPTYALSLAHYGQDGALYESRRHLWETA